MELTRCGDLWMVSHPLDIYCDIPPDSDPWSKSSLEINTEKCLNDDVMMAGGRLGTKLFRPIQVSLIMIYNPILYPFLPSLSNKAWQNY